jgi:hypothetical protein
LLLPNWGGGEAEEEALLMRIGRFPLLRDQGGCVTWSHQKLMEMNHKHDFHVVSQRQHYLKDKLLQSVHQRLVNAVWASWRVNWGREHVATITVLLLLLVRLAQPTTTDLSVAAVTWAKNTLSSKAIVSAPAVCTTGACKSPTPIPLSSLA